MTLSELFDLLKYPLSLAFGASVIALFATRRLELLTTFPSSEEFQLIRALTASTLVGKKAYRRAYAYYVALLELFYFSLCTFEPIAKALFSKDFQQQFKYEDVAWPFGA